MNAVDSEHNKNRKSQDWRVSDGFKACAFIVVNMWLFMA